MITYFISVCGSVINLSSFQDFVVCSQKVSGEGCFLVKRILREIIWLNISEKMLKFGISHKIYSI